MDLLHPCNPNNPIGITNPASPLYMGGRQHHGGAGVDDNPVMIVFVIALAVLCIIVGAVYLFRPTT